MKKSKTFAFTCIILLISNSLFSCQEMNSLELKVQLKQEEIKLTGSRNEKLQYPKMEAHLKTKATLLSTSAEEK